MQSCRLTAGSLLRIIFGVGSILMLSACASCGVLDYRGTGLVANWDVIPSQVVTGVFEMGVVAFHPDGAEVTFYDSETPIGTVDTPTQNPRTGVWEYTLAYDFSTRSDGPHEMSALVEPDGAAATSRRLETITLHNNSGGSLPLGAIVYLNATTGNDITGDGSVGAPYETLEKGFQEAPGGTVYLQAGTYDLSSQVYSTVSNATYWTTLTAAPGESSATVHVRGGAFNKDKVIWDDVTLIMVGDAPALTLTADHSVWIRNCVIEHESETDPKLISGDLFNIGGARLYVTDTLIQYVSVVFSQTHFARNVVVQHVGGDIIRADNDQLFVGISVDDIDPAPESHTDVIQVYNPAEVVDNIILYNFLVTNMNSQGIFGGGTTSAATDMAFVNLVLSSTPTNERLSQLSGMYGVLMWHCTFVDAEVYLREPEALADFDVRNNVFHKFHISDNEDVLGSAYSHNMWKELNWDQPAALGDNAIVGDPLVNASTFILDVGSPARNAGESLESVPADINGTPWTPVPHLGALAD